MNKCQFHQKCSFFLQVGPYGPTSFLVNYKCDQKIRFNFEMYNIYGYYILKSKEALKKNSRR